MDNSQITARIQQSVDRLTPRDSRSEQRLEVRGARAVFNKKVYLKGPLPVPIAKLDLKLSPKVRVKTILNEWAAGANLISLMSEDLLLHLNLLVRVCPRNWGLFQALVLGENLPFILLTLYDGDSVDSTRDRHKIADFAMRCARALTSQLLNYCTKDFILLPCTLEYSSFDVQGLREEVKGQKCGAADFYQGPTLLREESCKQICTALSILATASDVPYFFAESPDAGKKLLVGDSEDDNVLHQIISYLWANGAANSQPLTITYTEMTTVVKVILLEAAKRLSYFQRVMVITESDEVQKCVEKLANNIEKEFGRDPSSFQSVSLQEYKLSKHTTGKDKTALSSDADMTDRTSYSELSDRHHEEPATHQKTEKATAPLFEGANSTTVKMEESIPEKLASNKETYTVSGLAGAVKSNESTPKSTAPATKATAVTETHAQEENDSARRKRKKDTEKPLDLIEPSSNDMAPDSHELVLYRDETAAGETFADEPTPKKRKIQASSETGQREGNSDTTMNLDTSMKGGKDREQVPTCVIAIDTPECPKDCHLRLMPSESYHLKPSPEVKDRFNTILNELAAGANLISLMSEDLLRHSDEPTLKKRKIQASSETGLREENSDATMNLDTSTVVEMDDYSLLTCVTAIDTPECPKDCHLRLMPSESYPSSTSRPTKEASRTSRTTRQAVRTSIIKRLASSMSRAKWQASGTTRTTRQAFGTTKATSGKLKRAFLPAGESDSGESSTANTLLDQGAAAVSSSSETDKPGYGNFFSVLRAFLPVGESDSGESSTANTLLDQGAATVSSSSETDKPGYGKFFSVLSHIRSKLQESLHRLEALWTRPPTSTCPRTSMLSALSSESVPSQKKRPRDLDRIQ